MALHLDVPFIVMSAETDDQDADTAEPADDFQHSYPNVGREAMAYLTFIVQYYDCLAEVLCTLLLLYTTPGSHLSRVLPACMLVWNPIWDIYAEPNACAFSAGDSLHTCPPDQLAL